MRPAVRPVTKDGIRRCLAARVQSLDDGYKEIDPCKQEIAFRSFDQRLEYVIYCSRHAGFTNEKLVRTTFCLDYNDKVYIGMHTKKYILHVFVKNEYDQDDGESRLPMYAQRYAEDCLEESGLWHTQRFEELTDQVIQQFYERAIRLQNLTSCGCGSPTTQPGGLCLECTMTSSYCTDDSEGAECLICLQDIHPHHEIQMPCCKISVHRGCLAQHNSSRCCHCRQNLPYGFFNI